MNTDEFSKQVASLGTIMGIWAHPDDEVFMTGGLLAQAVQNGQTVVCVTATRGEKGVHNAAKWPADKMAEIRTAELAAAYKILGVGRHHWLEYPDGGCVDVPDKKAVKEIYELIEAYQPNTVITFPPNGSTGHPDHKRVSSWTVEAASKFGGSVKIYYSADLREAYDSIICDLDEMFNIYFNVTTPYLVPESSCDVLLRLPTEVAQKKCDALSVMPSQTEAMFDAVGKDRMCEAVRNEGFVRSDRTDIRWPN